MAKVTIKGILDCFPQMSKNIEDSGLYYVIITEDDPTAAPPEHLLPVLNVKHGGRDTKTFKHSSHKCEGGGCAVFFTDQTALAGCMPGDAVECQATLYSIRRPYWDEAKQQVRLGKVPSKTLILDGKIRKVKEAKAGA